MSASVVDHLVAIGEFDHADLPVVAECEGWRLLVDASSLDVDDHDLVVTVRPSGERPEPEAVALVDAGGTAHLPAGNQRGQLRFEGVADGPWHFMAS